MGSVNRVCAEWGQSVDRLWSKTKDSKLAFLQKLLDFIEKVSIGRVWAECGQTSIQSSAYFKRDSLEYNVVISLV